ncbi:ABC transporter ATP-binding protein [Mycoplasmopsis cricetuli]|uniref:ABC transporter ATP-binding protein n=1 Tax=Mycoplasmopsis cricetuli TaxID=171283 RepID=UPI00047080E7|nr:ABC transporter ATP-binding protein [Mycoplasmopsis cricetuli]
MKSLTKNSNFNENLKLSFKESKKIFQRAFSLIWKNNKKQISFAFILIVISNIGMIFNQIFIGKILVDGLLIDQETKTIVSVEKFDFQTFYWMIILGIFMFSISILANFFYQRLIIKITFKTMAILRSNLYEHTQKLPINFFEKYQKGELLSRYTSDIDTLRQFLINSIPSTINALVVLFFSFVVMLWLSWILSIITITSVFLIFIVMQFTFKNGAKHFKNKQKSNGKLTAFVEEMLTGLKIVKIFNYQKRSLAEFQKINNNFFINNKKANQVGNILFPVTWNLGLIVFAIVSIIGGLIITTENHSVRNFFNLTVGVLISFSQFSRSFANWISVITQQSNTIITAMAGTKRIFEILDQTPEENTGKIKLVKVVKDFTGEYIEQNKDNLFSLYAWKIPHQNTFKYQLVQGKIEFKNVFFKYQKQKNVLKNISFIAYPGQQIALVGSTGSGKTTIIKLINRFYDLESGEILYDDININDIDKFSLRESISMVLQETHLFSDTIKNNIGYGSKQIINELIEQTAKISNIANYIEKQKDTYNTLLTYNGNELSQGQKQLISIARALYNNSPIVVLDEATSNIDIQTEMMLEQAMDKVMFNRTSFIIAHRLSTIKNASQILVIYNGKIIEQGTHEQLLQINGYYSQMWNNSNELVQLK